MDASVSDMSLLLIDAPVGRHFAQLHRDRRGLTESLALFVTTGLHRGNGVVVLATADHTNRLLEIMKGRGMDHETFRRSGQLTILDAEAVLKRLIVRDMPDWKYFRRTMGSVIEGVQAFGRSSSRVYGELVSILWRTGRQEAAIRLEEYWNELSRLYPFSLFCGYMIDSQTADTYSAPLHDLARTHTDIVVTEEDERFRAALDAACRDIFGVPIAKMVNLAGIEENPGEDRLPGGQRTMLWIMRNMPSSSAAILERARRYYHQPPQP